MPLIFSGPVTGWPSMRIEPRVGMLSPVASFMKVLLPQPEGPTMAMNSPAPSCSVMSSTANWPCASSVGLYASQTPLKSTNAVIATPMRRPGSPGPDNARLCVCCAPIDETCCTACDRPGPASVVSGALGPCAGVRGAVVARGAVARRRVRRLLARDRLAVHAAFPQGRGGDPQVRLPLRRRAPVRQRLAAGSGVLQQLVRPVERLLLRWREGVRLEPVAAADVLRVDRGHRLRLHRPVRAQDPVQRQRLRAGHHPRPGLAVHEELLDA